MAEQGLKPTKMQVQDILAEIEYYNAERVKMREALISYLRLQKTQTLEASVHIILIDTSWQHQTHSYMHLETLSDIFLARITRHLLLAMEE